MPPKSSNKKSAAIASWLHCEKCNVHITSKERETHDKICPINHSATNVGLEYISNNTMYTCSVERKSFTIDDLTDMPAKYVDRMIFISEGAIRLSQFHIGQNVAIHSLEKPDTAPLIRTIWPVPEKFLTTVFVTEEDFQTNWIQLRGTTHKIQGICCEDIAVAKCVHFKQVNDADAELNENQILDVKRILKQETKNCIYTSGNLIRINFFNKTFDFIATNWQADAIEGEMIELLENALQSLQLKDDNNVHTFFQIAPATRVEVIYQEHKYTAFEEKVSSPEITYSAIGGLDEQIKIIKESIQLALGLKQVPKGVKVSRGLLLYGSTGCGKTLICEAIANNLRSTSMETNIIRINTSELFSKFLGETEKNLTTYFKRAYLHYPKPSLIIIEDIHNLCPKYENNEVIKRVSAAFLSMLDELSDKKEAKRTFLLATTSNIEALSASVRRCGRLDCEVEIGAPSPKARMDILKCLLSKVEHNLIAADIEDIANITHGFVGADLANLVYNASLAALKNSSTTKCLHINDIRTSLTFIKPSAMREVLIENPNVRWSDIGGQQDLKLKLKQAIEWPLIHPEKFKRLGIKPPRGILMFGPPGCSKTMIAKALATESQLNFLSIKGPELFSMWVGESERAVREVFRKARQVAPAIVFFDEIDAISSERSDGGSGSSVKERVLTQLLTEMDGVESLQNVTIVAATNRPDMIDKALLRPGRIDRIVYVGLPDATARREIFRIKLKAMPLANDVIIENLVENTEGYSGAEIQAICHEAALKTLEESFDSTEVSWSQFQYALNIVKPRTSNELLKIYEEYIKKN